MITVDWSKWRVFFADERAVAKSHPESNYKLIKDEFLSKVNKLKYLLVQYLLALHGMTPCTVIISVIPGPGIQSL